MKITLNLTSDPEQLMELSQLFGNLCNAWQAHNISLEHGNMESAARFAKQVGRLQQKLRKVSETMADEAEMEGCDEVGREA